MDINKNTDCDYYIKELVDNFNYDNKHYLMLDAKECALIAVDEIIEILSKDINPIVNYWFEVKREIENL